VAVAEEVVADIADTAGAAVVGEAVVDTAAEVEDEHIVVV
jgi:hypothetical protein